MVESPRLAAAWRQTAARIAPGDAALAGLLPTLVAAYGNGDRHYHTLGHVLECLDTLAAFPLPAPSRAEIELALWFHDAVYDSQRGDNESASADLLRAACGDCGLPSGVVELAARFIQVTDHRTAPANEAEQLIADIDMAILAAPSSRYSEYTRQVRAEYACFDDAAFREGRAKFLAHFLAKPRIYHTPFFHDTLEAAARANMQAELAALSTD